MELEIESIGEVIIEMADSDFPEFSVTMQLIGEPGPQGPPGPPGDVTASSVGQLSDVELANLQDGDTLVYSTARFRNVPIVNLVDGGNF